MNASAGVAGPARSPQERSFEGSRSLPLSFESVLVVVAIGVDGESLIEIAGTDEVGVRHAAGVAQAVSNAAGCQAAIVRFERGDTLQIFNPSPAVARPVQSGCGGEG